MPRARRGRHRRRSTNRAAARVVGLPALVALAGTLVATVPDAASAAQVPVGTPSMLACHKPAPPTATGSASASAAPSDSASASASASSSASDSQTPTSAPTSPTGTASASARPTTGTLGSSPCAVVKTIEPSSPAPPHTHSPTPTPTLTASSRQPLGSPSPSRSVGATSTPTSTLGSATGLPPVDGQQEPFGPITRAQIMQRALAWIEQQVPYSQTSWWVDAEGSYRQDCSGYVSMAWGLDQAVDFWTGNLDTVSHQVPADQMLPGDILLSTTHTVLFAGWADSTHTTFDFYEESHPGTVAHYVTGASLAGYLSAGFVPYSYDGVVGSGTGPFVTPTAGVPISALGPLPAELAPVGQVAHRPAPAPWQTDAAPGEAQPATQRPVTVRAADLEPAAAEIAGPGQEAGPMGVAVGGSVLLFTGLSLGLTRRRNQSTGGPRPRRRH